MRSPHLFRVRDQLVHNVQAGHHPLHRGISLLSKPCPTTWSPPPNPPFPPEHTSCSYLHEVPHLWVVHDQLAHNVRVRHHLLHERVLHHLTKHFRITHQLQQKNSLTWKPGLTTQHQTVISNIQFKAFPSCQSTASTSIQHISGVLHLHPFLKTMKPQT